MMAGGVWAFARCTPNLLNLPWNPTWVIFDAPFQVPCYLRGGYLFRSVLIPWSLTCLDHYPAKPLQRIHEFELGKTLNPKPQAQPPSLKPIRGFPNIKGTFCEVPTISYSTLGSRMGPQI